MRSVPKAPETAVSTEFDLGESYPLEYFREEWPVEVERIGRSLDYWERLIPGFSEKLFTVYRVPATFFNDSFDRTWVESGVVLRDGPRIVWVALVPEAARDFLSDARYYSDPLVSSGMIELEPAMRSICGSAKRTVAALVRQGVTT